MLNFWWILKLKYKNIFHKFPSFPSAFILYAQIEWVQNSYTPFKVNLNKPMHVIADCNLSLIKKFKQNVKTF